MIYLGIDGTIHITITEKAESRCEAMESESHTRRRWESAIQPTRGPQVESRKSTYIMLRHSRKIEQFTRELSRNPDLQSLHHPFLPPTHSYKPPLRSIHPTLSPTLVILSSHYIPTQPRHLTHPPSPRPSTCFSPVTPHTSPHP